MKQKVIESDAICPGCSGVRGKETVKVRAGMILIPNSSVWVFPHTARQCSGPAEGPTIQPNSHIFSLEITSGSTGSVEDCPHF